MLFITGLLIALIFIAAFITLIIIAIIFPVIWWIVIPALIIYLTGVIVALPMAIYSEFSYEDEQILRPIKNSLIYSWIYVYTFLTPKSKYK